MKARGVLIAVLFVACALSAYADQVTFKGVKLLSRSSNPQVAASGPAAESRSTNPQSTLSLDSAKKTLTLAQPGSTALSIPYAQITGTAYSQNELTLTYRDASGKTQTLQLGLPTAQAEQIVNTLETHTGKTVIRSNARAH